MFTSVLIANRGEIARRIARTARELGLRTIGVYTDADRGAPHTRDVDLALPVPSYLDVDALVSAAKFGGAEAVHPGYGFLSERAEFARAVVEAGLTWVGPDADVIARMGRKDAAREIAVAAGVPVVPQGDTAIADTAAGSWGPVLVKAAAGGGGKGMRIVRDPAELPAAIAAAKRESLAAFGDDTMLIERYVEHGRHVEVQVFADQHGHVVHLHERDCSAQRRHQKVIEEAPAPGLSPAARETLLTSAVALAREVGYTNAGTVEFMVAGDEVFFLEMNTRLQVEHPVTEAITGLDLVRLQFQVAAGEPLPFTQDEVRCDGHAFEARVYAEDAWHGFLPQAGTARTVAWPDVSWVRVDQALESGQVVTTAFDPMLGKVTVHGPDRETARQRLTSALNRTIIYGLTTNTGFLRALAASDAFRDLEVDTGWLDRNASTLQPPNEETAVQLAGYAYAEWLRGSADDSPFGAADGWRLGGDPAWVALALDDRTLWVNPTATGPASARVGRHGIDVTVRGQAFRFEFPDPARRSHAAGAGDGSVLAPMPGTVIAVSVAEGDLVAEGDPLGVMEAMKMEHALKAPLAGTVTTVGAKAGDQVPLGHPLFVIEPSEPDGGADA